MNRVQAIKESNRIKRGKMKNIVLLSVLSIVMSSCALWPYKKDFDCPVKEGLRCKSLYEVSTMADKGMFGPSADKKQEESFGKCRRCSKRGNYNAG